MISHHGLLGALTTVLKDDFERKSGMAAESLGKFQWELEKHIFGEEAILFKLCKKENLEDCQLVIELEKGHTAMLKMLENIKNGSVTNAWAEDIDRFQKFHSKHMEREEKELYPKLDFELSAAEKEEVISKINEILIKKY